MIKIIQKYIALLVPRIKKYCSFVLSIDIQLLNNLNTMQMTESNYVTLITLSHILDDHCLYGTNWNLNFDDLDITELTDTIAINAINELHCPSVADIPNNADTQTAIITLAAKLAVLSNII